VKEQIKRENKSGNQLKDLQQGVVGVEGRLIFIFSLNASHQDDASMQINFITNEFIGNSKR
jgi:hypothetical protein